MSNKAISSRETDDGIVWDFQCPYSVGCNNLETGGSFTSKGWPAKEIAQARGRQHIGEHNGEGPSPDLNAFRFQHGLISAQPPALEDALKTLEV